MRGLLWIILQKGGDTLPEFQKYLLDKKLVPEAKVSFFAYWVGRFLHYAQRHDLTATGYQESNIAAFLDDLRLDNRILEWQPRQAEDALKLYYLTSEDIRDCLSHLALRQRVSSSTQNQAFNALLFLFRNVLNKETGNLDTTVRAKRGPKLPVVLSVDEIKAVFQHLSGQGLLIGQLLYGAGLRLMELARLRVKDLDFNMNTIYVRNGKGDKDRSTVLPAAVKEKLHEHLKEVKTLHEEDLAKGYGEVFLPDALDRKYPNAPKEWAWQYAFPSSTLSVDPRSGIVRRHHVSDTTIPDSD